MTQRYWGAFLIVLAFVIIGFVVYKNSAKRRVPIIFSPRNELASLWEQYKRDYLEKDTYRTLDKQKGYITTSEGQSYAMLRSVWQDDKDTFDKSWQWTKDILQRDDKLFSWLFGTRANGTSDILTERNGQNSATDADTDIALALIFAAARWNEASYLYDAKPILAAVWEHEVIQIGGRPYLLANNVEKAQSGQAVLMNPSYLSPYAYRIFAKVDPDRDWMGLVDTSYDVLERSIEEPLDRGRSAGLPPDWVMIDRRTAALSAPRQEGLTTDTSFDALRVPWRVYLDWAWFKEERAASVLRSMSFLSREWRTKSLLHTSYTHDGEPLAPNQSAAFYGGTLGYFMLADPEAAKSVHDNKLQILFTPDSNTWKTPLGYYDDNWAWFGIALYNDLLPNLAAPLATTTTS